jgi:hypothetical protein
MPRREFGYERTACACEACVTNCRYMPGFLIPADLGRMIPAGADPFRWAEANLLASPGALVADTRTGQTFHVPTLVPAVKADGSCIHLAEEGRCGIWAVSPFGCAFFDCGPERGRISHKGIRAVLDAHNGGELYTRLWDWLWSSGRRQKGPQELRSIMREAEEVCG